ncbi:Chitin synthase, class 2 [Irineochytrium annulatum]|nr:Chitin synthase, class 2 [Irineochytrium annulatum]
MSYQPVGRGDDRRSQYPVQRDVGHGPSPPRHQYPQQSSQQQHHDYLPQLSFQSGSGLLQDLLPPQLKGTTTLRRAKPDQAMMTKEVKLDAGGNLVLEVPVSGKNLVKDMPYPKPGQPDIEFTHLRYTAATCDPDEFKNQYMLRGSLFGRRTRIAVVITMYNEDDVLLSKSLAAVMKNVAYLCSGRCAGWSKEDWKDVVICIVSDGRAKVNPLALNVLGIMGCYMDGLAKASVNGKDVTAHIYEYSAQIAVRRDLTIRRPTDESSDGLTLVPCQIILLIKEKNLKKINSHRWFFNAVCGQLNPDVCVLVDAGTKPSKESFYHLYRAFDRDPNVAGACGEICTETGKLGKNLLNPVVALQNFEYKMSNILDKPLESVFGYISVLPGAFSAYRYEALQGMPLACYFKGENATAASLQEANMYLAEDRILCFELVVKSDARYLLKYVKSARAETDVPDTLESLIKQRRRWINGSFFAQVYATYNWQRIFKSGHGGGRRFILLVEFFYNLINILFGWFNLGNFFLTFYFLFNIASDQSEALCRGGIADNPDDPFFPHGAVVFDILTTVYTFTVMMVFIASLGNRPDGSRIFFTGSAILFALIMGLMMFMGVYTVVVSIRAYQSTHPKGIHGFVEYANDNPAFRDIVISTMSTYGLYVVSSFMHLEPWHIFTSMLQYLFLVPSMVNILTVYAFCNLHDISWGTKGLDTAGALKPVVAQKKDGAAVVVTEVPSHHDEDIESEYDGLTKELQVQRHGLKDRKEKESFNAETEREDNFKQLRTNTLLLWLATNGILVYVFTSPRIVASIFPKAAANALSKTAVNPYLTFLFWSVAALSAFRFLFSFVFLVGWWSDSLDDAGKRNPLKSVKGAVKSVAE